MVLPLTRFRKGALPAVLSTQENTSVSSRNGVDVGDACAVANAHCVHPSKHTANRHCWDGPGNAKDAPKHRCESSSKSTGNNPKFLILRLIHIRYCFCERVRVDCHARGDAGPILCGESDGFGGWMVAYGDARGMTKDATATPPSNTWCEPVVGWGISQASFLRRPFGMGLSACEGRGLPTLGLRSFGAVQARFPEDHSRSHHGQRDNAP